MKTGVIQGLTSINKSELKKKKNMETEGVAHLGFISRRIQAAGTVDKHNTGKGLLGILLPSHCKIEFIFQIGLATFYIMQVGNLA